MSQNNGCGSSGKETCDGEGLNASGRRAAEKHNARCGSSLHRLRTLTL